MNEKLFQAVIDGNLDEVKRLIKAGADVNAKNTIRGDTALMIAAENGHTEVAAALIKAGADFNAKNTNGWTALLIAAKNGHTEVAAALIKAELILMLKILMELLHS